MTLDNGCDQEKRMTGDSATAVTRRPASGNGTPRLLMLRPAGPRSEDVELSDREIHLQRGLRARSLKSAQANSTFLPRPRTQTLTPGRSAPGDRIYRSLLRVSSATLRLLRPSRSPYPDPYSHHEDDSRQDYERHHSSSFSGALWPIVGSARHQASDARCCRSSHSRLNL